MNTLDSLPKYKEENYKRIQGGNLWEDYSEALYKCGNEEIDIRVREACLELYYDSKLNYVNKSNGNTLIIVERAKQGHFSVYVAEGYKEATIEPIIKPCSHENLIDTGYGCWRDGKMMAIYRCEKCGREIYKREENKNNE